MARKQAIIIYPHLNDCGGDLTKDWYVECKYQIPGETKQRIDRTYKGIRTGPEEVRRANADKVIKEKTEWLKSGGHLAGNVTKVYADELEYRTEAKAYGQARRHVVTTRTNLSEFLSFVKQKVNAKSYTSYQSKIRAFNKWLLANKLHEVSVNNIERKHIIDFVIYLADEESLSKLTIKKYIQNLHAFFEWEMDNGRVDKNPVYKIPVVGKIVDQSATPFQKDEREWLKEAIEHKDPQLWLACQIQYYCAIRPGTELRLIKVGWIDWDNEAFRVPCVEAKNSKTEIVAIPDFLMKEMREMQLHMYSGDLYIFGRKGRPGEDPVGQNTLRNRFNRFRDDLGISPDRKFYSWKHTGAIQLLQNGAKPFDIKNHLRHKKFETTEIYLRKLAGNYDSDITEFSSEI